MGCGASSESQHDSLEMYEMEDEMEERVRRKHIQQTATQDTFLPPQEDAVSGKKTLVLDMDETLLHSSPTVSVHALLRSERCGGEKGRMKWGRVEV
mmetsp:Transcript_42847/g.110491  ORF Transcript_42847/g.110491 Transcript_42847/m.110491 type:complete len:96 (+) Transcript_42847:468-755(+)|eukprot:CAMPEP_0113900486 /NCGR_PEP_ID=MMETSP0780_2-20120614/20702_1 /TAXON_ID=652834 /ORGANISM="Palpitomonas bilix" /LENGTH=95 /DNA_ID=CAMNT_0000892947 /DNA_START=514 /DNA_END=801 /DNA_ORIENTATION=- /assembly_acc=CAM_ASM_000599